jgi:hypothetical protein
VANNSAAAVTTGWGKCMDCALKAIERMRDVVHDYLKGFVILIPAGFALRHGENSSKE